MREVLFVVPVVQKFVQGGYSTECILHIKNEVRYTGNLLLCFWSVVRTGDILPSIQKAIVHLIGLTRTVQHRFCMAGYGIQIASHGYYRIVNQLRWQLCVSSE